MLNAASARGALPSRWASSDIFKAACSYCCSGSSTHPLSFDLSRSQPHPCFQLLPVRVIIALSCSSHPPNDISSNCTSIVGSRQFRFFLFLLLRFFPRAVQQKWGFIPVAATHPRTNRLQLAHAQGPLLVGPIFRGQSLDAGQQLTHSPQFVPLHTV